MGILLTTGVYLIVYWYRFWTAIGLRSVCFPFMINCQMVLLGCNVVCHVGV
ncbi:putative ELO family protein [Helianthus anomalus]